MSEIQNIIDGITKNLNDYGITITWISDLTSDKKFSCNTNIRHENNLGSDTNLKSIEELCSEFKDYYNVHCNNLIMMLHTTIEGPYAGCQYIYYDFHL